MLERRSGVMRNLKLLLNSFCFTRLVRNGPVINRQNFGTVLESLSGKDQGALNVELVCFCACLVLIKFCFS